MYGIVATISLLLSISAADNSVSISSFPPFLEQRDCAKLCLWQTGATGDLVVAIGCSKPWVNGCFCQRELASKASSFISTCVASRCGGPKENTPSNGAVTRALGVYNTYCADNGMPIPTVASIKNFNEYLAMPECARLCLWHAGQSEDDLMPNMGCGEPWDNGCLCDRENNEKRVSRGMDFMAGCVASRCGTRQAQDGIVTEALGVWGSYCRSAGLPLKAITEGATTEDATTIISMTMAGTTAGPSQTDSQVVESEPARVSVGAIIGIVLGTIAAVSSILVAAVTIMYKRRLRKSETDDGKPPAAEDTTPGPSNTMSFAAAKPIYEKLAEKDIAEADNSVAPRYELSDRNTPRYAAELPA